MEVRYKDEGGGVQVAQLLLEECFAVSCARDGNVLFVDKAEVSPLLNPTLDEQLGIGDEKSKLLKVTAQSERDKSALLKMTRFCTKMRGCPLPEPLSRSCGAGRGAGAGVAGLTGFVLTRFDSGASSSSSDTTTTSALTRFFSASTCSRRAFCDCSTSPTSSMYISYRLTASRSRASRSPSAKSSPTCAVRPSSTAACLTSCAATRCAGTPVESVSHAVGATPAGRLA